MFQDTDGTTVAGTTWTGVILRVIAYRKRAKLPPGLPAEEVIAQACERNPGLCTDGEERHEAAVKVATLKARILKWLSGIVGKENSYVSSEEHKRRADICSGCVNNKALPGGCSSCVQALKEYRERIIGSRFVDGRLHGCNGLGEYLPVSTHLELQAEDRQDLPEKCWRRRSL